MHRHVAARPVAGTHAQAGGTLQHAAVSHLKSTRSPWRKGTVPSLPTATPSMASTMSSGFRAEASSLAAVTERTWLGLEV